MSIVRGLRSVGFGLLALVVLATGAWGALALGFAGPDGVAGVLGAAFGLAALASVVALAFPARRWYFFAGYAVLFLIALYWWSGLHPSNDREWQTDVEKLASATVEGHLVHVRNIRNFDYRGETDYTPGYEEKTYDLDKLQGVDLIAVYWMGPAIAHTFLSFDFGGSDHLAISIETRKKKGDIYSTLRGFFRQYELYYVVADERDVIRLRTNYRHDPPEDVYIYRMKGDIDDGRRVFLQYIQKINALNTTPEFYNTLTSNCTTDIWSNTLVNEHHVPLSWKILLSGYVPEYLYETGRLDTHVPFDSLRQSAHVNERAHAADEASDFSQRIRATLDATQ